MSSVKELSNTGRAVLGLLTGYHWALAPEWIIGVGTSTMFSNNSKTFTFTGPCVNPRPPGAICGGDKLKLEAGRDLEAHVKVGYIVSDYALLYAKVGYANAKVKAKATINGIKYEESDTGSGPSPLPSIKGLAQCCQATLAYTSSVCSAIMSQLNAASTAARPLRPIQRQWL